MSSERPRDGQTSGVMTELREEFDMQKRTCAIDGCDRPSKCQRMCIAHYTRYRRTGNPGTAEIAVKGAPKPECSVPDCTAVATSKGMCHHHWRRVRRHGDPNYVTPRTGKFNNYWHGDNIGIGAAHLRVKQQYGLAFGHQCVMCGGQARHWAYDHTDPNEKDGGKAGLYSVDPAHYQPMCVPCHKRFDLAYIASKRVEA